MTAPDTWDVFATLDGYGSFDTGTEGADWGGYWSKQVPELLEWRAGLFAEPLRKVYGATTFREFAGDLRPRHRSERPRRVESPVARDARHRRLLDTAGHAGLAGRDDRVR